MENDEAQDIQQSSGINVPRLPRSYNFLIQLSRRMGTVATKSSFIDDVRTFMKQEITISPTEKVFRNTLPKLTVSKADVADAVVRAESKPKAQRQKDLQKLVSESHQVLMTSNTVFPMSLFPDTVTLDRTKVTITRRDFFWSSDTLSIRIEDVLNVQVSLGPLFGSLTIASRVMSTIDHFKIGHLWRSDAIRLKQIIQGYMIAQHNKIDTSHLSKKELVETLVELGHDSN